MNYKMKNHIAYFFFVAICAAAGLLIVSYGGGMMLALMIGVITIPFAIVLGTIPLIALTLVLSIPFYIAITWKLSRRQVVGIVGGIVLALPLSAGIAWGGRIHLFQVGEQLIAADTAKPADFHGKHVLITDTPYPNSCRWPCAELLYIRGARSVSFSRDALDQNNALPTANITFELGPYKDGKCISKELNEVIRTAFKDKNAMQYLCVRKRDTPVSVSQVILEIDRGIVSDETESFNPFANAIVAKRTRIEDISGDVSTTVYQYTSVDLFLPFWVLWPISLGASEQAAEMKGLLRSRHVLKVPLDVKMMLFGQLEDAPN